MPTPLYAYTDESGNTGLDIFHRDQPVFYTLTLFSKSDLNVSSRSAVATWCNRLGVPELHAGELGVRRLATIAPDILAFLVAERPLFFMTAVEKRHMAAMKFADTVLDAGLNMAMSPMHYNMRPFRLRLALDLAKHMTPRMERAFWDAYARKDLASFRDVVHRVESSIAMRMPDPRGREILGDALRWAAANPEELLVKRSKLDAPNLVAFSFILQGLHDMLKGTDLKVSTFIHDEQNEFMKSFQMMYEMMKRVRFGEDLYLPTFEEADTFDCPLTEQTSANSPALQLVDVLLWLAKRYSSNGTTGAEECDALLVPVLVVGMINEFSRRQLEESAQELWQDAAGREFTPKQLRDGKRVRDAMESARKARMLGTSNE